MVQEVWRSFPHLFPRRFVHLGLEQEVAKAASRDQHSANPEKNTKKIILLRNNKLYKFIYIHCVMINNTCFP
jgi:uncharacterized protein with PIN domain